MNSRSLGFLLALLLTLTGPVFGALTDGLALYYSFNTNNGSVVIDQSGNGHTAQVKGAQYSGAGVSGGAYEFSGTNWIEAGDIFDLTGATTQLTVCAWVKAKPVGSSPYGPGTQPTIVSKQQEASPYRGWILIEHFYNKPLSQIIGTWPEMATADGTSIIGDDQWHFVCTTYEAYPSLLRVSMYVDGLLEDIDTRAGPYASIEASTPLTIGARQPNSPTAPHWSFKGLIDEVRIYSRIMSDADVAALYEATRPRVPSDALITEIGFSNDPDGDQDVTEFLGSETLYIRLKDVDMDSAQPSSTARAFVTQRAGRRMIRENVLLARQPDGSFLGSCGLSRFQKGAVSITVYMNGSWGKGLIRSSTINVH